MRFLVIISIILLFSACSDKYPSHKTLEKRLTQNEWKMNSYTNYKTNEGIEVPNSTFIFLEDGTFEVIPQPDTIRYYTDWEFVDNYNYLRISQNTYKIETLTNKLLGLNFGNVRIYYVPKEK